MDVKKKRGRKPKVPEVSVPKQEIVSTNNSDEDIEAKKKRGRKPKYVYSTEDIVASNQVSLSDDENVIVRLNVPSGELEETMNKYNDEHPYAYNRDEYSNISNITYENNCQSEEVTDLKVVSLLKDFEEKNKINEWPSNTSISCYWCCHKFDNPPFGIPVNYTGEKFDVFGCFCSLECAASYNFKMQDSIDEMWERHNLINMLYRKLNVGKIVKPAPDKLALKMFGGYMDIDEFRSYFRSNKVININFPPMTSLTQQIEEINEYEVNNDFKYIPLDQDRVEKYKAKILVKRTKPLNINKNSLESSMNLKYVA